MDGTLPGVPRIAFGAVDVRDVADRHMRAMIEPAASAERFVASAGDTISLQEVALLLKTRMGDDARQVPTELIPDAQLRDAADTDPNAARKAYRARGNMMVGGVVMPT